MISRDICEDRSRITVQEDLRPLTWRVSWWVLWVLPTAREGGSVVELIKATKDASTYALLCRGMPRSWVLPTSDRVMKEIGGHHWQLLIGVIPKSPSLLRVNALIPEIFHLILAPNYKMILIWIWWNWITIKHERLICCLNYCILKWERGWLLRCIAFLTSLH